MDEQRRLALIAERNAKADRAYDKALAPARLASSNPARVPYPEAITPAIAAYDAVIAEYRPRIWP